jgi:hypothetical protein
MFTDLHEELSEFFAPPNDVWERTANQLVAWRRARNKRPSRPAGSGKCESCGGVFARQASGGPVRKFCSDNCRKRTHKRLRRAPAPTACETCGAVFVRYVPGVLRRKFCSEVCSKRPAKAPEPQACETCSAVFVRRSSGGHVQRFCSPKCKRKAGGIRVRNP